MSAGPNGARRIASLLRPSINDSRVCRSCQETLVRRNYATETASAETESASAPSNSPSTSTAPSTNPRHIIQAGVLLSRAPQITRDLTPFEKSFFFYQKRLNERLTLPFMKYFYFNQRTPAADDWRRQIRERQAPTRDVGSYGAYSKDAWNDELLVGAKESEPDHMVESIVKDAQSTVDATSQDSTKQDEIPRPAPRVTEADKSGDQKSLNRLLQRSLYLLVQTNEGKWKLPSSAVQEGENLRGAAERTLEQTAGVHMNTWMVGYHPVGHHIYTYREPRVDQVAGTETLGEKTFFMKCRILAGQADLLKNEQNVKDFKWVSKEELAQHVLPGYFSNIKNMLPDR